MFFMKALVFVLAGLFFLSLVSGASYPSPFMSDNTAIVYGSDTPSTADIPINLGTNIPTVPAVTSTQTETDKQLFSKKDICILMKGCWVDWECFPNGYRIEDNYCGVKRKQLINQSNAGEDCDNSFECKSNFCFNGECVDTIRTVDDGIVRINKSDLEELRGIIENAETSLEENYEEEKSKSFFSSLSNLFKKMFSWW